MFLICFSAFSLSEALKYRKNKSMLVSQCNSGDHSFGTYTKFSEKLIFLHVRLRIRDQEILISRKRLRTY